jgi:hypothetical protein
MLETQCVGCHHPEATDPAAARLNLTAPNAYASLIGFGQPSLHDQVWTAYRRGHSVPGDGIAQCSALWALLDGPQPHNGVQLSADARERWLTWLDTYAQQLGSFSLEQEQELLALRDQSTAIGTLLARETTQPGSLP